MRRPAEVVSQRVLAYELKRAIDQAMSSRPVKARHGRQRVDRLCAENPVGVASTHVQHNLGNARRAWFASRALPRRHERAAQRPLVAGEAMTRENENPPVEPPQAPAPDAKEAAAHAEDGAERVIQEPIVIRGDAVPDKKG